MVDGVLADLEMQIYHEKRDSDQQAVVSVFFSIVDEPEKRNLHYVDGSDQPGEGGSSGSG